MDPAAASLLFREAAAELGFARVGFAPVGPVARHDLYRRWLAAGYAGEMGYLVDRAEERRDPALVFAAARTVVTVALPCAHEEPEEATRTGLINPHQARRSEERAYPSTSERQATEPAGRAASPATGVTGSTLGPRGRIARYARGADYHVVLKTKLNALGRLVSARLPAPLAYLACCDTAPVIEREVATRGGVGFIGKNNLVIAPGLGSHLVLGELLVDLECQPGLAPAARCGECRACLDACPTGAFVGPYLMDARRCISYLTIELPGPIPRELRSLVGDHVFGCDVCQDVCPYNARAGASAVELAPQPGMSRPVLTELLEIGSAAFRKWKRDSARRRIHRPQLQRNAAVALGNIGGEAELSALGRALGSRYPLVRGHAAWAVGRIGSRIGGERPRSLLTTALAGESDPGVREELEHALAG